MTPQDPAKRFWAAVDKTDDCWLWTHSRHSYGHGQFFFRGHNTGTHRVAWILTHGEIPSGMCVCHVCDVAHCVRPDHLFLGSQRDNLADMRNKRRGFLGYAVNRQYGERNVNAVLTASDVKLIRTLYADGDLGYRKLAKQFGVVHTSIASIIKRRTWKEVP